MNRKLTRALAALLAGLGVFAFAGCKTESKKTDNGPDTEINNPDTNTPGGGNTQTPGSGSESGGNTQTPGNGDGSGGNTQTPGSGGTVKPEEPALPTYPAGSVNITEAKGDQESAYAIWDKVDGAMGYNVYYKNEAGGDFVKLDAPLVREYKTYCRADAVGLKAGTYTLKVVPLGGENLTEDGSKASSVEGRVVVAHERTGYAFADGNVPGAYNLDGTLKSGAQVVYVTAATAKTVTATVNGTTYTGFQSILDERKQSSEPLCFRIVGTVSKSDLDHISSSAEGIQIKGSGAAAEGKATSNITIEGIGSDGTVNGFGFLIRYCKNVELRNLGIVNFMDDGVSVDTGNSHLWMHNLDIFYGTAGGDSDQAKGDGSLDIKKSTYCTVSYNHFWDSGKCCLLDASEASSGGSDYITYHHNWFDHSDSRHARVRNSTHTHIYNNYFDGNSKYGVGAAAGSTVFVENNYFRSTAEMTPMIIGMQAHDIQSDGKSTLSKEVGGMIKAFGNKYDCSKSNLALIERTKDSPASLTDFDCYTAATKDEQIPSSVTTKGGKTYNNFDTASDFYKYTVDSPDDAKTKIELYAGRVGGGDLHWNFDDATEDSNYGIIPGLKSAVTNYKPTVVKIGNVEVSGGSTSGGSTSGGTTGGETGGDSGNTGSNTPVEGEVTFIPTTSGNGFTVTCQSKSHSALTVAGVEIPKNGGVKINDAGNITFSTTSAMKLYLYVANTKTVKVDGTAYTPTAEGSYYVISVDLPATATAQAHTIEKGGGENVLYLIKLVPKTA